MAKDQQGLALTGSADAGRAYDRAVADYWGLTGDPVGLLKQAAAAEPDFVLGHIAVAGLFLVGSIPGDHPHVLNAIAAAEQAIGKANARERLHLEAVKAFAAGSLAEAARRWEAILVDHPTDALALRFSQDAYYFLGAPIAMRDCVARVWPEWDRDDPLASFVLGARAFGFEETGELARAEEAAREALALNSRDAWATHALAHVLETASRQDEGIAFLKGTHADWSAARFMAGHNGWHLALYLIEHGRFEEVLEDYDRFTAPRLEDDLTLDRCDAAALLWRLELEGVDVGNRWSPVARAWMAHADDHVLAFNDLHCALAAARSPDPGDLARFMRSLDAYCRDGRGTNRAVTVEVGRKLIEGVTAFAKGDDARAIEAILPVRYEAIRIGGSHAQRDIIGQTLIAAAERAGRWPLARALLAERVHARPTPKVRAQHERARTNASN